MGENQSSNQNIRRAILVEKRFSFLVSHHSRLHSVFFFRLVSFCSFCFCSQFCFCLFCLYSFFLFSTQFLGFVFSTQRRQLLCSYDPYDPFQRSESSLGVQPVFCAVLVVSVSAWSCVRPRTGFGQGSDLKREGRSHVLAEGLPEENTRQECCSAPN